MEKKASSFNSSKLINAYISLPPALATGGNIFGGGAVNMWHQEIRLLPMLAGATPHHPGFLQTHLLYAMTEVIN